MPRGLTRELEWHVPEQGYDISWSDGVACALDLNLSHLSPSRSQSRLKLGPVQWASVHRAPASPRPAAASKGTTTSAASPSTAPSPSALTKAASWPPGTSWASSTTSWLTTRSLLPALGGNQGTRWLPDGRLLAMACAERWPSIDGGWLDLGEPRWDGHRRWFVTNCCLWFLQGRIGTGLGVPWGLGEPNDNNDGEDGEENNAALVGITGIHDVTASAFYWPLCQFPLRDPSFPFLQYCLAPN